MSVELFGTLPDGRQVDRVLLKSGDLTASFLTWGASLQDLRIAGHDGSLVLGLSTLDDYLNYSRYFGATAGRCANRIRNAKFALNGIEYQLDSNFLGKHHLHGGTRSLGKMNWTLADHGADFVTFGVDLPDGHMGYPGKVSVQAEFTLDGSALDIRYTATSDQPTLCNLAHHTYWILDNSGSILDHNLSIDAETYTPVDDELIPTGQIVPVSGSNLDFRQSKPIRAASDHQVVDLNFCLGNSRETIRKVATLNSQQSGISMSVLTTEPGLQVYDSGLMNVPVLAIDERALTPHSGLALEPQIWPDAINNSGFPQAVLNPGETYDQHTRFEFEKR